MAESIGLILTFSWEFRKCFFRFVAFERFVGYIMACILSYNRITITGIYRFMGCDDSLSKFHKFLRRSPWKPEKISEILFKLLMKYIFELQETEDRQRLILLVDSTVIGKSGSKTDGVDKYYSSTLEKQQKGNEICRLSIILKIPELGILEFPVLCRLYVTEKSINNNNLGMEYFTREVIGAKIVELVRKWTVLAILLIGDALYSTETTINPLMKLPDVNLISRRRNGDTKSGVAWELPENPGIKVMGRPCKKGKEIRFNDIPAHKFEKTSFLKRGKDHIVKVARYNSVLIRRCSLPVTVIIVLERDDKRYVLVCTDNGLETSKILELYRIRFQIEFGFRDAKQYLGFGDYQVRRFISIWKHLTISQTAYSLCKIAYVLNVDLRKRTNAIFYLRDFGKKHSFSMMSLKEELRSEFFSFVLGQSDRNRIYYLSLIFSNNRFLPGNYEKILPDNAKQGKMVA